MTTRPPRSLRPARPATWMSSWHARSAARKSGRLTPTSAATAPTTVTLGRSNPLAIICVPTRTSASWAWKLSMMRAWPPCPPALSASQRRTRTDGNRLLSSDAMRWVPLPKYRMRPSPQAGHTDGLGNSRPQVWHCSRSMSLCQVRTFVQAVHSITCPHMRHMTKVRVPRRLINRMACSRRSRAAANWSCNRRENTDRLPAISSWRMSTSSMGGSSARTTPRPAEWMRCGNRSKPTVPCCTRCSVCSDGVAEPMSRRTGRDSLIRRATRRAS